MFAAVFLFPIFLFSIARRRDSFRNKSKESTCTSEAFPCFGRLSCSFTLAGVSTTLFFVNSVMVAAHIVIPEGSCSSASESVSCSTFNNLGNNLRSIILFALVMAAMGKYFVVVHWCHEEK